MPETLEEIQQETPESFEAAPPISKKDPERVDEPPTEKKVVKKRGPYKKTRERDEEGETIPPRETEEAASHGLGSIPEFFSPKQEKAAREAGRKAVQMLINFPGLYNPDLLPRDGEPTATAAIAFMEAGGEYFVSQKYGDLPPGMAFALAGIGYYAVLLSQERNRGFLKESWSKMKAAWAWWKARRAK